MACRRLVEIGLKGHDIPMSEIVKFPRAGQRHQGKTLCRSGFHQWVVDKERVFDVKAGKLVTRRRCARCGAVKVEAR